MDKARLSTLAVLSTIWTNSVSKIMAKLEVPADA
jgi:hypothetical protein